MVLKSGSWQVELHAEDSDNTIFVAGNGVYQFKVVPFRLSNAPATLNDLRHFYRYGKKF